MAFVPSGAGPLGQVLVGDTVDWTKHDGRFIYPTFSIGLKQERRTSVIAKKKFLQEVSDVHPEATRPSGHGLNAAFCLTTRHYILS